LPRLVADQRQRWQRGERGLVEAYLREWPVLLGDTESQLDLIYNEMLLREDGGEVPGLEEYVRRFPHLEAALALQLEVDQGLRGDLMGDTVPASPTAGPETQRPGPPGYVLLEEIGRGGMGVVYKARQVSLGRPVALKMLRNAPLAGADDLARFRHEGELAARLQHPNIVSVFETGVHEGVPFLALEYVEGGNLAQHLGGAPQLPAVAAQLLAVLARAVDHAHQHGIVHRDLKPANVLLSREGSAKPQAEEGQRPTAAACGLAPPKITDFGLAKWLSGEAPLTRTGDVLGTPGYMAPEQATARGKDVGPHTDVYALGAILYECLTGRPPFCGATPMETLLHAHTREPVPPSQLRSGVPRDLETICLKCLRKEPARRYASAAELAEDLDRFQAGRPILARPVGPWERARKWARRRPAAAALMAVSAAALLALLLGGWWSSLALSRAARREAEQRRQAEENFRDALDVVDHLLTEVAEVDLVNVPQMEPVRKKLLLRARRYYEKFLEERGDDPSVRREAARAHLRLGDIQELLGERDEAEKSYTRAVALLGPLTTGPEGSAARQDLARAHHGLAVLWRKANSFARAEKAGREALRLRRQLAEERPEDADCQRDLAASEYHQGALLARLSGRQKEAEKLHISALARQSKLAERFPAVPDHARAQARTLNNLGILLKAQGRPEAGDHFERAVRIQKGVLERFPRVPAYRWELARYHSNLGAHELGRRRPGPAEKNYGAALKWLTGLARDFPTVPDYRQDLAAVHANRGQLFQALRRWDDAESSFRSALALRRELTARPDDRHKLGDVLVKVGNLRARAGKPGEAEKAYREALGLHDDLVQQFPMVAAYLNARATALHHLGEALCAQGKHAEARGCLDRGIKDRVAATKAEPSNHFYREWLRHDHHLQAEALLGLGDHGGAARHAEELPRLHPDGLDEYLRAARLLARTVAVAERAGQTAPARAYGGRTVALLRTAVKRGFRDAQELRDLPAYASVRGRADFQELLGSLK
jgi:serine/threonine protein kinase